MFGKHITKSLKETQQLAAKVVKDIPPNTVIGLIGNLGTGKTAFAQGFAKAMGVDEAVGSSTFKLISEYKGSKFWLYHIDCYRLNNSQQFINIGGVEYLTPSTGFTLIEWADIIEDILPKNSIIINFSRVINEPECREIIISRHQ